MTAREALIAWIRDQGGDGLCNCSIECGCSVDDLAPCDYIDLDECEPAKGRTLGPDERVGECGPGDTLFAPVPPA